jgi:hypothetical protein
VTDEPRTRTRAPRAIKEMNDDLLAQREQGDGLVGICPVFRVARA